MPTEIQYGGLLWGFVGKLPLVPLYFSRGNRRLIAPYILLFNLLLIISYLGGLVIRGVNTLITADYLNRFSNGSPSLIRVARDWHVLWPDLGLALASLYPDSARDPAGDLWRYLVTNNPTKPGLVLYFNQYSLGKRATWYTNCINGPLCAPILTTLGKK